MNSVPERVGKVEIRGLLGTGGMGEVYEGFDPVLQRRVAVKVVRRDRSWSEDIRARFLREGRVLARLDHGNVCRVYDFVEGEGVDFLILELVEGVTLRQAMREGLEPGQGLAVAEQLAGVLAAAHQAGVVHRDLKPENVMVTADGTIKVLDFGLARALGADEATEVRQAVLPEMEVSSAGSGPRTDGGATTQVGALMGTLQFMSPEQAQGRPATPASDMYAFGLLFLEMMTGRPAYPDALPLGALFERVREGRFDMPDHLDPKLQSLIGRLLRAEPEERPTAAETRSLLRRQIELPGRRRQLVLRSLLGAAVLGVVAASAVVTYRLVAPRPWLAGEEQATVAVFPFRNDTSEPHYDWVERGLADVVAATLTHGGGVDVVPVSEVVQALGNLRLDLRGGLRPEATARLLAALGAQLAVHAEVSRQRGAYRLVYRVVGHDGVVADRNLVGGDLHALAEEMAAGLSGRLRAAAPPSSPGDVFSEDSFANRAHAIGVFTMDTAGPRRALVYFRAALDRDPGFVRSRLRLAQCLERLGEWDESEQHARDAAEAAGGKGDPGLEGEALRVLGTVAHARGRWQEAEGYLTRSLEAAAHALDSRLRAETLNDLGRNAMRDNRLNDAERYHRESIEWFLRLGDQRGQSKNLSNLGMVAWRRGDWEMARSYFGDSLAVARLVEDQELQVRSLNNLAAMAFNRRELSDAAGAFAEVLSLAERVGNRDAEVAALANLAAIHFMRWELEDAQVSFERALFLRQEMGDLPRQASILNNLARVGLRRGDRSAAERDALKSLSIREQAGDARGVSISLVTLVEIRRGRSAPRELKGMLDRAVVLAREAGDRQAEADATLAMASLAMDEGKTREARQHLDSVRAWRSDYDYLLLGEARLRYELGDPGGALESLRSVRDAVGEEGWRGPLPVLEEICRKAVSTGRREAWLEVL